MPSPAPLPSALRGAPLTPALLRAHGVAEDRIRRRDIVAIGSGVHLERRAAEALDATGLLRMRARGVLLSQPEAWVSHTTSAALANLPLPQRADDDLHISVPPHHAAVRRSGVVPHQQAAGATELRTLAGLTVSGPERMFLECATLLPRDDLVALGDALVRTPRPRHEGRSIPYSSRSTLSAYVTRHPYTPGMALAADALTLIREGADSAPETRMRLALLRAGLPEPQLQVPADPLDPRSPEADMAYVAQKIALQYDGQLHFNAERAKQDRWVDRYFISRGWAVLRWPEPSWPGPSRPGPHSADGGQGFLHRRHRRQTEHGLLPVETHTQPQHRPFLHDAVRDRLDRDPVERARSADGRDVLRGPADQPECWGLASRPRRGAHARTHQLGCLGRSEDHMVQDLRGGHRQLLPPQRIIALQRLGRLQRLRQGGDAAGFGTVEGAGIGHAVLGLSQQATLIRTLQDDQRLLLTALRFFGLKLPRLKLRRLKLSRLPADEALDDGVEHLPAALRPFGRIGPDSRRWRACGPGP